MTQELHIGIVGAGSFAAFAANAFLQVPDVRIIAVADPNAKAVKELAQQLRAKNYSSYQELLLDDAIELVYIATPPYLHFEISKNALLAGKHVICEKPAALKISDAESLKAMAEERGLLYVVNLMQRYNPIYHAAKNIIEEKILGEFLHGYFENYASDENLDKQHWFWDEAKSGGIFIEHAVHFFDMFAGWFGHGQVVNAIQLRRPGIKSIYDRVQATVRYKTGLVNFYHGFDQPKILDRQEMRLVFEKGDITLYEWVPVKIKLHGLVSKDALSRIEELLATCSVVKHDGQERQKKARGRFSEIIFDAHVTIEHGNSKEKQTRYQQMLTGMLQDQWAWVQDRKHVRVIDDSNAVESLRISEKANEISQRF